MDKVWLKNYPGNVPAEIELDNYQSIADLFLQTCPKYADKAAYTNMGSTYSYQEIFDNAQNFAFYLQNNLQLKKGARIAIMLPNLIQYPIAMFGAFLAEMVVVNINPLYTERELQYVLKDSGAEAIIIIDLSANLLENIIKSTDVKHIILTKIGDCLSFPKGQLINLHLKYVKKVIKSYNFDSYIKFSEAIKRQDAFEPLTNKLAPENIAFLQYTGGTTGVFKAAILTHRNIIANIEQAFCWLSGAGKLKDEIVITPLPLYHIFSLTANCFLFFKIGGLNVLITNPKDINGFVNAIKKYKFTAFTGVNTLFNSLIRNKAFKNLDFSRLRISLGGGMAVQKEVAIKWREVTGNVLVQAYGLTETSPAAIINLLTIDKFTGSIGMPISSIDIKVICESGSEVDAGEVGELCIKGPNVMRGYWNRPNETKIALTDDGWLLTGDLAKVDADGNVYIVDRKKDMILVSGFNVYPNELEDLIMTMPGVLEVAVVGVPHKTSGEAVKLFVVKSDQSLTEENIYAFCRENFTHYKRPKYIEFRHTLPKSNVGKVLRRELRAEHKNS